MSQVVTPGNLGPEFLIGTETPNQITVAVAGPGLTKPGGALTVTDGSMTYNVGTSTLTYTASSGNVQNIDLSALTTDIYVDGASFNPTSLILTLTDNDAGTPDVTVDLSALLGVSTDANNALINGADGKPFLNTNAFGQVSADAGNLLTQGTDNLPFVDEAAIAAGLTACTDAFGVDIFKAFAP